MDTALIILRQTVIMFLYMTAGYIMFRTGKMTVRGSRDIATLLIWLVIPAVIVDSFCVEFTGEKVAELLQSAVIGTATLLLSMAIASLAFRKSNPVGNFGTAFSNAGFIGIPLVTAAFGSKAVFWIVGIVALNNLLQWSYGVSVITGKRSAVSIRHIVMSPIMAAIAIGLVLFCTGAGSRLPEVVSTAMSGIASLNAPLAMIVLGSYLAQSDIRKMLTTPHQYWVCAVRLIVVPLFTILLLRFIPVRMDMLVTIFITACAPLGANVAVYAQLYDKDYPYACQLVALSTLLSIITMPLMLAAAGLAGLQA